MDVHSVHATSAAVLFIHSGDNEIRGSERVLLDLLRLLDRRRFHPLVWCDSPAFAEAVRSLDIPATVDRFCILMGRERPRFDVGRYLRLIRKGRELVASRGVRLMHVNASGTSQWTIPISRAARIPMLVHLHVRDSRFRRYKLGLHQVPFAVGPAGVLRTLIDEGLPESRTRVIYNGIDPRRLEGGDARRLRETLGIPPEAVVLTAVAALIRLKGLDVAIQSIRELASGPQDVRLLIAGEGEERKPLEQMVRDFGLGQRVHFLGRRSDVGAILRDATDILVLPSRTEVFPLAALEAGVARVPVVATRIGGVPELVADGETGLLVPREDPGALARAIAQLAADPAGRRRMGEAARARVLQHFTLERMVQSFEDQYQRMIAEPREVFGWRGRWTGLAPYRRLLARPDAA